MNTGTLIKVGVVGAGGLMLFMFLSKPGEDFLGELLSLPMSLFEMGISLVPDVANLGWKGVKGLYGLGKGALSSINHFEKNLIGGVVGGLNKGVSGIGKGLSGIGKGIGKIFRF